MDTTSYAWKLESQQTEQTSSTRAGSRRRVIVAFAIAIVAVVWYLFRPELLFFNKRVNESLPVAGISGAPGTALDGARVQGVFHSGAHETKGTAAIYELAGGKRVLRLTGFETSNGPDVHVFLGKAADAVDSDTVKAAGYLDLGSLKGNIGDQNYEIPADANLAEYRSVTIWCNRFNVNFGTAPLDIVNTMDAKMSVTRSLASGAFHGVAHETKGTATVHELADGERILRLTGFETSNGPDVHIFLGKATDAADNDTVKTTGYLDLGSLKGNVGDQNYSIPKTVDLAEYKSVTVWCSRFNVNFGTAPLKMN
jgi:hypothetical protein